MKNEISSILKRVLDNLLDLGKVPASWKEALISLIPKEGQDFQNVKNYRLILLLNDDYKIGARIFATRMKSFLINYTNKEQTGFLPMRQIRGNLRFFFGCNRILRQKP